MRYFIGILAAFAISITTAGAAVIHYMDGTLANEDWATTVYQEGGAVSGSSQQLTGGNPDSYRQTTHAVPGGYKLITVFHANQNAVYNPATQGSINSIDYSLDYQVQTTPNAVAWLFGLKQDGTIYMAADSYWATVAAPWSTQATNGLAASDFSIWYGGGTGSVTPDFSTSGAPITLGYLSANSSTGGSFSMTFGVDNFNATVDHEAIPEPGTLVLLGGTGLVIGAIRRCTG